MGSITQSVDVDVPVRTAYNHAARFEAFPHFVEGVESVVQHGDATTHWRIKLGGGGAEREFDARITVQRPDECIAWVSVSGPRHVGIVTFQPLGEGRTRVTLQIQTDPQGPADKTADAADLLLRKVKGDLRRFADFVEQRGEVAVPPAM
ncbi:SRPBCC family protein [Sinosporangium siamense]|uniref:Cyclase n=1 Tax=Sinosporangium siamense TaxID=1367973 RepID=A0A919V8Q5_9ACTN|nr:SRPBCC family protein [Sinosporangium siamense]GII94486.1 cyclase [Sinosporangium siamense]